MTRLLLTLAAITIVSSATADVAEDVRCREIAFSRAAEARDAEAFRRYLDADARFLGNDVLHGPDEIVAAWRPFLEPGGPAIRWRPRFVEVLEDESLALTRGPYRLLTVSDSGEPVERWGTFTSVWRLHDDGEWRVVFDAGSPAADSPSLADEALLEERANCP